jgi:carbon monoxide dehydrogenase subunit G
MTHEEDASVNIQQRVDAPAPQVAAYMSDFRHAKEWMVGVEYVESLGEDTYRLRLSTPVGKLEPDVTVHEHSSERVRWSYNSTVEGGGLVEVSPDGAGGSIVTYKGEFRLKQRLLSRVARVAGMNSFARKNGERSLARLKYLMEARRY